jgi:hypothetical protein
MSDVSSDVSAEMEEPTETSQFSVPGWSQKLDRLEAEIKRRGSEV